jgi:hypothetical protein
VHPPGHSLHHPLLTSGPLPVWKTPLLCLCYLRFSLSSSSHPRSCAPGPRPCKTLSLLSWSYSNSPATIPDSSYQLWRVGQRVCCTRAACTPLIAFWSNVTGFPCRVCDLDMSSSHPDHGAAGPEDSHSFFVHESAFPEGHSLAAQCESPELAHALPFIVFLDSLFEPAFISTDPASTSLHHVRSISILSPSCCALLLALAVGGARKPEIMATFISIGGPIFLFALREMRHTFPSFS